MFNSFFLFVSVFFLSLDFYCQLSLSLSFSLSAFFCLSLCLPFSVFLFFLFLLVSAFFSFFLSLSLSLSLFISLYLLRYLLFTDKKFLAAEGVPHFWLDKDFYYIDLWPFCVISMEPQANNVFFCI